MYVMGCGGRKVETGVPSFVRCGGVFGFESFFFSSRIDAHSDGYYCVIGQLHGRCRYRSRYVQDIRCEKIRGS